MWLPWSSRHETAGALKFCMGSQETYVELSVVFRLLRPSGLLKSLSMSTSSGCRWPVIIMECSGAPISHSAISRRDPARTTWSSAPTRASPTHTVSSVNAAATHKPNYLIKHFQSYVILFSCNIGQIIHRGRWFSRLFGIYYCVLKHWVSVADEGKYKKNYTI